MINCKSFMERTFGLVKILIISFFMLHCKLARSMNLEKAEDMFRKVSMSITVLMLYYDVICNLC